MELEELKDEWQKYNRTLSDKSGGSHRITIRKKSWFIRNKIAISGVACIATALLLFVLLLIHIMGSKNEMNFAIIICCSIIGLYAFVKGIFTLLYFRTINKIDNGVYKFMHNNLRNQLFFVYEQMLWLWVLLPCVLTFFPIIFVQNTPIQEGFYRIYLISVGIIYLIIVFVFSRIVCRKRRKILSEINHIER